MIICVADFFYPQSIGGAELTLESFLSSALTPIKRVQSHLLTEDFINEHKDETWIFGNFTLIADPLLIKIAKTLTNYHILEFDYKYCELRCSHKHIAATGFCECEKSPHGKLVAVFFYKAKALFWMSEGQRDEYHRLFPILKKANNVVISSSFSDETLQYIKGLDTSKKNNKYLILDSGSWIKGVDDCVKYANDNGLEYEKVFRVSHKEMLNKMASSKGLIFLPKGLDTCPRITIEAKLLGCDVITNENVQHRDEWWFNDEPKEGLYNLDPILEYVSIMRWKFFDRCLDETTKIESKSNIRFHFVVPAYNARNWITKTVDSILMQRYKNHTVTVIDDVSTDNMEEKLKPYFQYRRFNFIKNTEKKYALLNIITAIENLKPKEEDVIVVVDGDDWLPGFGVLDHLADTYENEGCVLTYGSYVEHPSGRRGVEPSEYPEEVIKNNLFRRDIWRASHLRTFKYKLWREINKEDLKDLDGQYYKMSYDQAMMLPMLEMAGELSRFIPEILHVYNRETSINVDKVSGKQQYETMLRIRSKEPYERRF